MSKATRQITVTRLAAVLLTLAGLTVTTGCLHGPNEHGDPTPTNGPPAKTQQN